MKKLFLILLSVFSLTSFAQNNPQSALLAQQIIEQTEAVDAALPQINILIKKGEKVQARTMVEEALQQITKIEADQKTLALLDESADDEILMTAEVAEVKRYLTDKANKLRNAIGIYITCDAKLFDTEYPVFLKDLQGELSQLGVSFVDSVEQADWSISIQAKAREYNKVELGGAANYFVYVDAQITMDKIANGKRVLEDAMSEKGGHTFNYEQAALDAYKHLTPRLSAAIKAQIEK